MSDEQIDHRIRELEAKVSALESAVRELQSRSSPRRESEHSLAKQTADSGREELEIFHKKWLSQIKNEPSYIFKIYDDSPADKCLSRRRELKSKLNTCWNQEDDAWSPLNKSVSENLAYFLIVMSKAAIDDFLKQYKDNRREEASK